MSQECHYWCPATTAHLGSVSQRDSQSEAPEAGHHPIGSRQEPGWANERRAGAAGRQSEAPSTLQRLDPECYFVTCFKRKLHSLLLLGPTPSLSSPGSSSEHLSSNCRVETKTASSQTLVQPTQYKLQGKLFTGASI